MEAQKYPAAKSRPMSEKKAENQRIWRIFLSGVIMVTPLLLLTLRLWQVQVVQSPEHQRRIQRQSIRPILLNPVRGRMLTAGGEVLVGNRNSYDLVFHISEMRQPGRRNKTMNYVMACASRLAVVIGREHQLTMPRIKRHFEQQLVMPIEVITNLNQTEIARVLEMSPPIPGVEVMPQLERDYPHPGVATHLTGFTGMKWPDGRSKVGDEFALVYVSKEQFGREGLEAYYDDELRGRPGLRQLRVDTLGYVHEELPGTSLPIDGYDLHLTVDLQAQISADIAMQGQRGALVVVDVETGGVLAMASAPTYDASNMTQDIYDDLRTNEKERPLVNRAVNGSYMPGSIVKPLVLAAALENGVLEPDEFYHCTGSYLVGNVPIRCVKTWGHGDIDAIRAITVSCNPFFIYAGVECTLERLTPIFSAAGIGERCGIDYPEIQRGLLPSRALARRRWKRNWLMIDTVYVSIGQGAIEMTPLQAAMMTASLANGGRLLRPYLVQSITTAEGRRVRETPVQIRHRLPVSAENLAVVREGMIAAVTASDGSARGLERAGIPLAAKTGTAEVGSRSNRHKNAWVVCYGPLPAPRFALACIIEEGDTGGRTAVPIAAQFLRLWQSRGGDIAGASSQVGATTPAP